MVPVRKPGRPLSTCPCPPGRPCACGGVKVAIPRKTKCGCGPGNTEEAEEEEHNAKPSLTESAISPTRTSFRVSKSGSVSRSNRKQSFDPTNLERMDPMSINLSIPQRGSLDATAMAIAGGANGMLSQLSPTGYAPNMGFVSMSQGAGNGFVPGHNMNYGASLAYDMGLQYSQAPQMPSRTIKAEEPTLSHSEMEAFIMSMPTSPTTNGTKTNGRSSMGGFSHSSGLGDSIVTRKETIKSSCCAGKEEPAGLGLKTHNITQPLSYGSSISSLQVQPPPTRNGPTTIGNGSCCSGKDNSRNSSSNGSISVSQTEFEASFVPQYQQPAPSAPLQSSNNVPNGGGGSCCSGKEGGSKNSNSNGARSSQSGGGFPSTFSTPPFQQTSFLHSNGATANGGGGSCCGGGNNNDGFSEFSSPGSMTAASTSSQSEYEKSVISQFQSSMGLKQQQHHNFSQQQQQSPFQSPTVYTYPGNYGSWQQPVDQTIWQQVASQPSMSFGGLSSSLHLASAANGSAGNMNGNTIVGDMGISHQCTCGPGCQCIGCLAHPFNDQTLQYVNAAYNDSGSDYGNGHNGSNGLQLDTSMAAASSQNGGGQGGQMPDSPTDAQTPSDASSSTINEEQSLSTDNYFFVTIPLQRGSCGGDMFSCPCGDDCECIGCLVHNNTVSSVSPQ